MGVLLQHSAQGAKGFAGVAQVNFIAPGVQSASFGKSGLQFSAFRIGKAAHPANVHIREQVISIYAQRFFQGGDVENCLVALGAENMPK